MIDKHKMKKLAKKFEECSATFIALGDTVRQQLLLQLANAGEYGMNVTNMTATSHLSRPAISHHLKVLKDSGMIVSHKEGTQVFYFIRIKENLARIKEVIASIDKIMESIDIKTLKKTAPWMCD